MKNSSYYKSEIERLTLNLNAHTNDKYIPVFSRRCGGWVLVSASGCASRFGIDEHLKSREMYAYLIGINRALNIIS